MVNCLSPTPYDVGWPTADIKSHTKMCSEFEKNAIGHSTFVGWLTLLARLTHKCITHSTYVFSAPY